MKNPLPQSGTDIKDQSVSFEFESRSVAPGTPWTRKGKGDAQFSSTSNVLTIKETGVWWEVSSENQKRHDFRKTFTLEKKAADKITVRKQTPDQGLLELLTLVRGENGSWLSQLPHLCLDDEYWAELSLDTQDTLRISWWSKGPKKNYDLHTCYHHADLARTWLNS